MTDLANTEHVGNTQQDAMLPLDRFESEGWFRSDQVIFLTVFRVFWWKSIKHAAFKWKDAISRFPVSPGSAEALVIWGGKIKYILIVYFLGNICAKIVTIELYM